MYFDPRAVTLTGLLGRYWPGCWFPFCPLTPSLLTLCLVLAASLLNWNTGSVVVLTKLFRNMKCELFVIQSSTDHLFSKLKKYSINASS